MPWPTYMTQRFSDVLYEISQSDSGTIDECEFNGILNSILTVTFSPREGYMATPHRRALQPSVGVTEKRSIQGSGDPELAFVVHRLMDRRGNPNRVPHLVPVLYVTLTPGALSPFYDLSHQAGARSEGASELGSGFNPLSIDPGSLSLDKIDIEPGEAPVPMPPRFYVISTTGFYFQIHKFDVKLGQLTPSHSTQEERIYDFTTDEGERAFAAVVEDVKRMADALVLEAQ